MNGIVQDERDFAFSLLSLSDTEDPQRMLSAALSALVRVTGAVHGYIEIRDEAEPILSWYADTGFKESERDEIRQRFSTGIMGKALAEGEVLHATLAVTDPRFRDFESVQANAIEAVLCAPIECGGLHGVVYLQGRLWPEPFADRELGYIKMFQQAVSRMAAELVVNERRELEQRQVRQLWGLPNLVAQSAEMKRVLGDLAGAATLDVSLLLLGPSGTGKSMFAEAVHNRSSRKGGTFIELNCASLPDELFENEMFGAAPGAHSAVSKSGVQGKAAMAHQGTLFLDEVAELSLAGQAKLLQFIQSGLYYRLGDPKAHRADIRLICATNRNLEELVRAKTFREDLYYRIAVMTFHLPSLAERSSDLLPLAKALVNKAATDHSIRPREFSPHARAALLSADWPGNVRQLAHTVEGAVVRAHIGEARTIETQHLFPHRSDELPTPTLQSQMEQFKRAVVESTLKDTGWNVAEAARRLDIARSYLYSLIRAHGLSRTA